MYLKKSTHFRGDVKVKSEKFQMSGAIPVQYFHKQIRITNRGDLECTLHAFQHTITVAESFGSIYGTNLRPKQMSTQGYHSALVRLLEKLIGILSDLGDESFVILCGEVLAVQQSANNSLQCSNLSFGLSDLTFVQQQCLLHKFISNCIESILISSLTKHQQKGLLKMKHKKFQREVKTYQSGLQKQVQRLLRI